MELVADEILRERLHMTVRGWSRMPSIAKQIAEASGRGTRERKG